MLEKEIGYSFKNKDILKWALTHSSFCHENKLDSMKSNEKLEFLGDAVLELSISSRIFNDYPELTEGELTKLRATIVCEGTIAEAARRIKLGSYLKMSRGETLSCGFNKDSILSDAFEALVGAIYLDGGFEPAKLFLFHCLDIDIKTLRQTFKQKDPKTLLQEEIQKTSRVPLRYKVIDEIGAEHDKIYVVNVSHLDVILGIGRGKSKKEAEQDAALSAVNKLNIV